MGGLRRAVWWHRILGRRGEPEGVVSPADFELAFEGVGEPAGLGRGALAYCADFRGERLLFTLLPRESAVFEAAFLYSAQLAGASGVVSVPFERLGELPAGAGAVFVFSPGRAGSTLLARLLRAAGRGCASEPDWPTQLCLLDETERAALGEGVAAAIVRAGVGSLEGAVGAGVFVKLRSHCNAAPEFLAGAVPGARAVVLLRGAADWAVSRHLAFGEPPDMVAQILRDALVAVDRLRRAGVATEIVWFEELVAEPALVLGRILGAAVEPGVLAGVMAADSQAGTGVERAVVRGREVEAGFLAGFEAEWTERRPSGRLGERLRDVLIHF